MPELANIQIKVFLQLSESLINAPVKKNILVIISWFRHKWNCPSGPARLSFSGPNKEMLSAQIFELIL